MFRSRFERSIYEVGAWLIVVVVPVVVFVGILWMMSLFGLKGDI